MECATKVLKDIDKIIGLRGKRRCMNERKAHIFAENLVDGATINNLENQCDMQLNHLSKWCALAVKGELVMTSLLSSIEHNWRYNPKMRWQFHSL